MRTMCQQKLKGWLIRSWDGKSQDEFGIQCISFQLYPPANYFTILWNGGEGLTKASTCNSTCVLKFEHFLKTGRRLGGQQKSNKKNLNIFFFSLNRPTGLIWSSSCNVHISVYMFICPLSMWIFQCFLLALRSHDQFKACHWLTLLPYFPAPPPLPTPHVLWRRWRRRQVVPIRYLSGRVVKQIFTPATQGVPPASLSPVYRTLKKKCKMEFSHTLKSCFNW